MKPLRIAYVVNVFPKLSESFIANEIAEVWRRGHEVIILSRRHPTETIRHPIVEQAGLDAVTVYNQHDFESALEKFQPDLIHAHFATRATGCARELATKLRIPFTFTAHRYDIYDKAPQDWYQRAMDAAGVITVSQANIDYINQQFGVPKDYMQLIPCGVNTELFSPNAASINDIPLIVCVARLHPVKNLSLLLRACANLRERGVLFKCVIIGEGDEREKLEAEHQQLNLGYFLKLIGAQDQHQVCQWWKLADIGVLTSHSEGMPVSLMEAASCGVPVVTTGVGGIPEMVDHNKTGLITADNDLGAFTDALELLVCDSALRQRMSIAARSKAEQHFSVEHQVDQMVNLWQSVVYQEQVVCA